MEKTRANKLYVDAQKNRIIIIIIIITIIIKEYEDHLIRDTEHHQPRTQRH
jgi:hypothetical protein